jgi:DNA-binding response OmpR family regulator
VLEEPPDVGADPWTPGGVVHAQLAAAAMVTAALGEAVLRTERVELDVLRHEVRVDGMAVWFALKEFELLELLLRFRGRVLSSEFLLARVWGRRGSGACTRCTSTSVASVGRLSRTRSIPGTW